MVRLHRKRDHAVNMGNVLLIHAPSFTDRSAIFPNVNGVNGFENGKDVEMAAGQKVKGDLPGDAVMLSTSLQRSFPPALSEDVKLPWPNGE